MVTIKLRHPYMTASIWSFATHLSTVQYRYFISGVLHSYISFCYVHRRENGMVTMKLRHPYTTASIWSSGKITCTGANTEQEAKTAARKFSRILQKLGKN